MTRFPYKVTPGDRFVTAGTIEALEPREALEKLLQDGPAFGFHPRPDQWYRVKVGDLVASGQGAELARVAEATNMHDSYLPGELADRDIERAAKKLLKKHVGWDLDCSNPLADVEVAVGQMSGPPPAPSHITPSAVAQFCAAILQMAGGDPTKAAALTRALRPRLDRHNAHMAGCTIERVELRRFDAVIRWTLKITGSGKEFTLGITDLEIQAL